MSIDELRAAVYKAQRGPIRSKLSTSFSATSPRSSGGTPDSAVQSAISSSSSGTVAGLTSYFPNHSTPRLGSTTSTPAERDPFRQDTTPAYFANLEFIFPTPSIYDLTLVLSSDVGITNFWNNIIDIFSNHYRATRITLTVPNDLTDVTNTPWGLKAVWNSKGEDHLVRPQHLRNSSYTGSSDQSDEWETMEDFNDSISGSTTRRSSETRPGPKDENLGVVFNTMQRLDHEEQPLIDNSGVHRVIERQGRLVLLSREFSDVLGRVEVSDKTPGGTDLKSLSTPNLKKVQQQKLRNPFDEEMAVEPVQLPVKHTFKSGNSHGLLRPNNQYEDYEQPITSPWSQSPAPSPAILSDATKNPFFDTTSNLPMVDESTFSPNDEDEHTPYGEKDLFEAIGMEGACSVIHIPLVHPSTAKQIAISGHKSARGQVPIAILSFMSEVVPYPANLISNLTTFAPFVATTLSQALSHSNILHQLAYTPQLDGWHSPVSADAGSSTVGSHSGSTRGSLEASAGTPSSNHSGTDNSYFSRNHLLRRGESEESLTNVPGAMLSPRTSLQRSASTRSATLVSKDTVERPMLEHRRTPSAPIYGRLAGRRASDAHAGSSRTSPRSRRRTAESRSRILLHSFGASLSTSFHSSGGDQLVKKEKNVQDALPQPSPRLMRVIVDAIPVCVMTASPINGRITWVNERTLAYSGKTADEFMRDQWSCLHPGEQALFAEAWQNAISKGEGFARQTRIKRFDNSYRWFMARAVPLRDSQGGVVHWFGTMMDVHDQKMAEHDASRQKETEASENKYRSLAEASPQIVFAASSKSGITYANTQWLKFSGKTIEETQNYGFFSQIHPADRQNCFLPVCGQLQPDESLTSEIRLQRYDGTYKWHLVKCICIEKLQDEEVWLGTCTDINDHKILEQRLQDAKDAAYKNMESKTRFLSNMSHEIRTPLIGITGMINFLLDTNLTAEQLDYAHTVQQSSEALLAVINDILDLSKVEAGMMKLIKESFPIRNLVEDANELLSTLAMAKQLELNYVVEEDVPEMVVGDRIRLRQVLLNIVGNAIKFTTEGEIFTRCFVKTVPGLEADEVVLGWETIDSGPGFNEEEGSVLFKPFSQVDGSLTRKHGGTGLGLVISKQLAELHGGDITCSSTKGVGSTFTFTARFRVPSGGTMQEKELRNTLERGLATTGPASVMAAFDVLVLSHSSWSIVALNHHIRVVIPRGVESTIVTSDNFDSSFREIEHPSGKPFTHIVVNWVEMEPQIDLIRLITTHSAYKNTKVIIISTPMARNQLLEKAAKCMPPLDLTLVFFVFKVVKPSKLSKYFDPASERNESTDTRRQTAQQVVQSQKNVFNTMHEDVGDKGYRVLLVEDNPVNQKVMTKYCKKAGLDVDTADDGEQCLKLYDANPALYNIILMDLHMPNLDGYQACARIRESERKSDRSAMPIIALSANVMSDVADRCKLAGFTSYLSKPVAFNTLSTRISELIGAK
ncbi:Peroxide stress-activated histidine kinase mak1 [Taphrina deformans PYCC 5710]|uniref:histidine kinase n=1 Tax=Taphrina deformans (strain PYCC 5710 / ATCC 11124 / CBS 356.35 / IMI 108563 / JCM 9778 / NBRC 8474) TaxID=1097556 RepID=R4X9N1_TAPDE|nr:Peroxide stress-activated histidine kinase mak1 [Taphrina deformans PYCC 5710]|eukprot:CCG82135.1 Peroxide stress-activated histidine kinase mak1 [Taphrina deformans PYCC 5710]